jgi:DNA-binding XRE family transcriptional regulator
LQEPSDWKKFKAGSLPDDLAGNVKARAAAVDVLEAIGVHVTLRPRMHEKLIIIDDRILWEGSINYLSWFDTTERARRWVDREQVSAAIIQHALLTCPSCSVPTLGQQLAEQRRSLAMHQQDLAQLASTDRTAIYRFEGGRRDVRLETLTKLCDGLDLEAILVPKHLAHAVRWFIQKRAKLAKE